MQSIVKGIAVKASFPLVCAGLGSLIATVVPEYHTAFCGVLS